MLTSEYKNTNFVEIPQLKLHHSFDLVSVCNKLKAWAFG